MKCFMVFDHLCDILYSEHDLEFADHINNYATIEGLHRDGCTNTSSVDKNIIVQIFSPIITSQRIMTSQFGNSYKSIQCKDGLNICFDEYMGYLFINIGKENIVFIGKHLKIFLSLVRYICGPDIAQLKESEAKRKSITELIKSYEHLEKTSQVVLVEAVEQLVINSSLSSAVLQALQTSVEELIPQIDCKNVHAMVMVQNMFVSLYSSQTAKELSPADILFASILNQCSILNNSQEIDLHSYSVFLSGPSSTSKCIPHIIHIHQISEGIHVIYFLEIGRNSFSTSLYEVFSHSNIMQMVQVQRDLDIMKPAFENLDLAVRKLGNSFRKNKHTKYFKRTETICKQMLKTWDTVRRKYMDFLRTPTDDVSLLRAETLLKVVLDHLKQIFRMTSQNEELLNLSQKYVTVASKDVSQSLECFNNFLKVKAVKNFSLGSRHSLTIDKYLEEFPGLVHFLHVDRTTHRITTPTIEFEVDLLPREKLWKMINFAKKHLQEGCMSLIWKDKEYCYSYFLWFEDSSGDLLKPTVSLIDSPKLSIPGILEHDFYAKLKEACFPKLSPKNIKCYELYSVHMGLVSASHVLEHVRRLAATVWELRGHPNHPIDLF